MHLRSLNACWVAAFLAVAGYSATIGGSSLADAAKSQDKDGVRALLKQHVDVNASEADGTTALHWAAHWNDLEMVDQLLRAGANVKSANRYGATPLSEAAALGNAALIERLLKAGAGSNTATTEQGETVLMTASRVNNLDAVKVLLAHGASVHAKDEFRGQTALMWAAAEGNPEVIKLLVARGAELNVRSFDRDTTLPRMEAGTPIAPIARGGLTALLFAARQGEVECGRILLEAGADVNQVDSDGNNALILATLNTHYDFAQMLLDHGAAPNVKAKNGRAALYTAVEMHDVDWSPRPAHKESDKTTSLELIQALLAHGADVNAQLTAPAPIAKLAQDGGDRSMAAGATAFMRAARSADVEVMRLLLDHNAEPTLANKDGLNSLMLAAGSGWTDHIKGTEAQAAEAVKLLLDLGFAVNDATDKGETALHGAAHRGADAIVKLLAEHGANVNARNKRGFTALDIAMGKGGPPGGVGTVHDTTAALLKQLGGEPGQEIKLAVKEPE